ncbi:hypothetical protein [Cellulosimicrobium funkei]|uniref:hypothetical protein n=1 Tax=Cellulosimicrobium funkei TaxID=264251 RepID=UPI003F8EA95E
MPLWLILVIVGAVLLILGVAIEAAKILIWIGIIVLVVSRVSGRLTRAMGAARSRGAGGGAAPRRAATGGGGP